ncbi:hypothetical protein AWB78_07417 [Caballeronia calidae]|uniref:Uncharacterized protein n=1 Tax=Caballeronia calidae TaxID=1777139 RepID=A0A158EHD7_9BURK|nr:hypothetical protein AWB78_07417 [Caballeronia calidae]
MVKAGVLNDIEQIAAAGGAGGNQLEEHLHVAVHGRLPKTGKVAITGTGQRQSSPGHVRVSGRLGAWSRAV